MLKHYRGKQRDILMLQKKFEYHEMLKLWEKKKCFKGNVIIRVATPLMVSAVLQAVQNFANIHVTYCLICACAVLQLVCSRVKGVAHLSRTIAVSPALSLKMLQSVANRWRCSKMVLESKVPRRSPYYWSQTLLNSIDYMTVGLFKVIDIYVIEDQSTLCQGICPSVPIQWNATGARAIQTIFPGM